jgi:hypothetical protein
LTVLLLPPRMTNDSQVLQHAALEQGWRVERLENWRPRPGCVRNRWYSLESRCLPMWLPGHLVWRCSKLLPIG